MLLSEVLVRPHLEQYTTLVICVQEIQIQIGTVYEKGY